MRNLSLCLLLIFGFISCKSKKIVAGDAQVSEKIKISAIIKGQEQLNYEFETLYIRCSAKYKDKKQSQSVSADIRIKKDEIIWINIKFLGFPAAKALITPTRVSYYEKLNNTYFDGDFELISNWLGTTLDFQKVQNLLLGKPIIELNKSDEIVSRANNLYQVQSSDNNNIATQYYFEPLHYLLRTTQVSEKQANQSLEIKYPNYQIVESKYIPEQLDITANQKDPVNIIINYKNIVFNQDLSYPFEIPAGYIQISIKK